VALASSSRESPRPASARSALTSAWAVQSLVSVLLLPASESTSPAADTMTQPKGRLPLRRAACDHTMALRR